MARYIDADNITDNEIISHLGMNYPGSFSKIKDMIAEQPTAEVVSKSKLDEAMELIKLSIDDIKKINHCELCNWFDSENNICTNREPCYTNDNFEWQHQDRYEKLKESD